MALFPKCDFRVLLPPVVAGARLDGVLELDVPEDIPRAERLELLFSTRAWAGYGSGKNRTVKRRELFVGPLHFDFPGDAALPRGTHRYPFAIDVPPWLPPSLSGSDCAIEHRIEVRLAVDWAIDPKLVVVPHVVLPPAQATRAPLTIRSPAGLHEEIVVEISLASTVRAQDEPLSGTVALRSGHGARFDAIVLSLRSIASIVMGRGDRRTGGGISIRVPADALRSGDGVPFVFPPDAAGVAGGLLPTFRTGAIDHDVVLAVTVDIPWAIDPSYEIPLTVLPSGSRVVGEAGTGPVGGERLRQIAAAIAAATGLAPGRAPVFVEGAVGPATVRVLDRPAEGRLGADVEIAFPAVDLGIELRPLGMLEGFRRSPLLPAALEARYLLRLDPREGGRPAIDEAAARAFVDVALGGFGPNDELAFDDGHLRAHFATGDDGTKRMVEIAELAVTRARAIVDGISALPSPRGLEASRPAWQAAAAETGAFFAPAGPSLHGLVVRRRILGGDERAIVATVDTVWRDGAIHTVVDVDLRRAPIPKEAAIEIMRGGDRLAAVRAAFPSIEAPSLERLVLERPGATDDPRALVPALEALLFWVLDTRGERHADQPYR